MRKISGLHIFQCQFPHSMISFHFTSIFKHDNFWLLMKYRIWDLLYTWLASVESILNNYKSLITDFNTLSLWLRLEKLSLFSTTTVEVLGAPVTILLLLWRRISTRSTTTKTTTRNGIFFSFRSCLQFRYFQFRLLYSSKQTMGIVRFSAFPRETR